MIVGYESNFSNFRSGIENYSFELLKNLSGNNPADTFVLYCSRKSYDKTKEVFSLYSNIEISPVMPERKGLVNNILYQSKRRRLFADRISRETELFHFFDSFRFVPPFGTNIVTFHDLFPITSPTWEGSTNVSVNKRLKKKFKSSVNNSVSIIANSEYTKNTIIDYYGIDEGRIEVIHLAASHLFSKQEPDFSLLQQHGILPGQKYFLFVGRIDSRKNISGMLKAFSMMSHAMRQDYKFVIVADTGSKSELKQFHSLVVELGIYNDLIHLRKVPDKMLANLYRAAFGFVFVTFAEGFGIPILEAMQSGCPVITSNTSSIPEVAGECAIYAKPNSTDSIKEAMIQLIENPPLRNELIDKGIEQSRNFSYNKTALQTYKLYNQVLMHKQNKQ